jgi:hypothetical protein
MRRDTDKGKADEYGGVGRAAGRRPFCNRQITPLGRARSRGVSQRPCIGASERPTGALLDRLTHHVHILEMNGYSYRFKPSKRRSPSNPDDTQPAETPQA